MNQFVTKLSADLGVSWGLTLAYAVVTILVLVMCVVCLVLEIRVWWKYHQANQTPISCDMTGIDAARFVLDKAGLTGVRVRRAGILREAIFGNYYNVFTNTIYLRSWLGKVDVKRSVTAVALGVQKAGLAKLCQEGDRSTLARNRLSIIAIFGPLLFVPVVLVGVALDFWLLGQAGAFALICLLLGGLLLAVGFIVTLLNIPVEKKANRLALEMMEQYGLATGQELETIRGVYDAYIASYIAQFLLQVLRVVQWALEIAVKVQGKKD